MAPLNKIIGRGPTAPTHAGRAERRGGAPRVPFALLVTGLIVGSLALLLALNTASAANELRRHGLVRQDAAVAAQVQDLRVRVAASAAPANLASAAAQLGMVPAGNPAFVVIGPDGKATVMGKPQAVSAPPVPIARRPVTPTPSASPTATPAAVTTAAAASPQRGTPSSRNATSGAARPTATASPARPTTPRPTAQASTPTPVVTLPGGAR